jgi:hypothetical protein
LLSWSRRIGFRILLARQDWFYAAKKRVNLQRMQRTNGSAYSITRQTLPKVFQLLDNWIGSQDINDP